MTPDGGDAKRAWSSRPGPKRPSGAPVGPEEVRRAILDAAEELFAERGVDRASLREIAAAADVQMALIWRYVGKREELIDQVFLRLSDRLSREVVDRPLQPLGFERDTVMGRWIVLVAHYVLTGRPPPRDHPTPIETLASVVGAAYGLDEVTARVRAAQITASGIGWRLFEPYVIEAASIEDLPLDELRADLTALHRRAAAIPWPTPEGPGPIGAPEGARPPDGRGPAARGTPGG